MEHILLGILASLVIPLVLAVANINTATAAELEALPGIDPAKARAMVVCRQQDGQLKTVEDLKEVKSIGEDIFSRLEDEVSVVPPAAKKIVSAVRQQ